MGLETGIEWCDDTANFWWGCTQVSPACDHCYAKELGERLKVVTWNGPPVKLKSGASNLRKSNRRAEKEGRKRFVFINSVADTFDNQADPEWRLELFDAIRDCPHIVALILTKRIGNVLGMMQETGIHWGRNLPNAWLGITVANQEEADRDIPKLNLAKRSLRIPKVFLSVEPMLGPINLGRVRIRQDVWLDVLQHRILRSAHGPMGMTSPDLPRGGRIDWVICGGESGKDARPMHPDWARSLRDQCAAAEVPFMFKQWGEWQPGNRGGIEEASCDTAWPDGSLGAGSAKGNGGLGQMLWKVGKKRAGRLLDGAIHNGRPQP